MKRRRLKKKDDKIEYIWRQKNNIDSVEWNKERKKTMNTEK